MAKRLKYTGACLLGLGVAATGCAPETPPFKPREAFKAEESLARQMEQQRMVPLPTTLQSNYLPPTRNPDGTIKRVQPTTAPTGPLIRPEDVRRMTLQEIIQRAVANNNDVRVAGYDPAVEQTRIIEAEANFDPTFFTEFTYGFSDLVTAGGFALNPNGSGQSVFTNFQDTRTYDIKGGVRQNLSSGGQISLSQELTYTYQQPPQFRTNPYYQSQLVLEATQPILRNFGASINNARIEIARTNTRVSVLDFRKQLEETLFNVEKTYWQLAQAEKSVEILERLLQRTENTADILLKRFGQEVSRVQTSQAAASVEARRSALVRARSQVVELSYTLKRLMSDPNLPVAGPEVVLTASPPVIDPLRFTLSEQIDAAMENRFDLGQQLLRIEAAGIVTRVARNNLLPALNLVGNIGAQGLDSTMEESWYDQNSFDNLTYQIGFQFEIPIGNRAANAIMKRTLLQRQQAIEQYEALVKVAAEEVSSSLNSVNATWALFVTSRQARFAAEDALNALQERENRGDPLTPDFVNRKLDAQSRLADQEEAEAEAVANYQTAVAQLERAKGTLLRYNNVQLAEQKLPFAYKTSYFNTRSAQGKALYPEPQ